MPYNVDLAPLRMPIGNEFDWVTPLLGTFDRFVHPSPESHFPMHVVRVGEPLHFALPDTSGEWVVPAGIENRWLMAGEGGVWRCSRLVRGRSPLHHGLDSRVGPCELACHDLAGGHWSQSIHCDAVLIDSDSLPPNTNKIKFTNSQIHKLDREIFVELNMIDCELRFNTRLGFKFFSTLKFLAYCLT